MKIKFSHIDYSQEGNSIICRVAIDTHSLDDLVGLAATSLKPMGFSKSPKLIEKVNVFINTIYEGRAVLKTGDKSNESSAKKIAFKKAERTVYKKFRGILGDIVNHNYRMMGSLFAYETFKISKKEKQCTKAIEKIIQTQPQNGNVRDFLKHGCFGLLKSGLWFRVFSFNDCPIIIYENGQWDYVKDYLPDGTQDDYDGEEIILIYSYASDYDDARDRIKRIFKTGLINQDEFLWTRLPYDLYDDYFKDKEKEQKLTF